MTRHDKILLGLVTAAVFLTGGLLWEHLRVPGENPPAAGHPARVALPEPLPDIIPSDKSDPRTIKLKLDLKRAGLDPHRAKYWKRVEP